MAEEPSFVDPSPFVNFPQFEPFDHSFNFPDGELPLPDGITPDLDLDDIYLDFSVDDLLLPSYDENDNAGSGSNSNTNSNLTTNSNSNSGSNPGSPESGNSSAASGVVVVHQETKQEESNSRLKRKLDDDDRVVDPNASPSVNPGPNSNFNPSPGSLKIRRSQEVSSPSTFSGATVEDEKRKARLMRNRESAQLSRQRKKHYVEELEEKVKFMNSTIADLNGKISFYMAENVRLHQQLNGNGGNGNANGGGNGNPAPAAVYPQPLPTYHFPWIPYPWHAMRPNGPAVPCIPIPRLKSTQPASAPRAKKSNSKKSESKTKKVASVSLVGLLFIVMVFGGVINFGLGGTGDVVYSGVGGGNGRIFSVKGRGGGLNGSHEFGQFSGRIGSGSHNHGGNKRYEKGRESPTAKHNSSESLPALLYVPRNGKHVEINGNLIIHSVLASERATAHAKSKEQGKRLLGKEGTGLTIPAHVASALAVPKGARDVERHSKACRNSPEHPRALASDSHDAYRDNIKSTVLDGPLEWFHEGLSGIMALIYLSLVHLLASFHHKNISETL